MHQYHMVAEGYWCIFSETHCIHIISPPIKGINDKAKQNPTNDPMKKFWNFDLPLILQFHAMYWFSLCITFLHHFTSASISFMSLFFCFWLLHFAKIDTKTSSNQTIWGPVLIFRWDFLFLIKFIKSCTS